MRAVSLLLSVGFLDEYASGLPVAGAPELVGSLQLSTAGYAVAVFAAPGLFATLIEAPLFAFSDRRPALRPKLVVAGLLGIAVALVIEAFATDALLLTLGLALYFPCSGLACGVAECMLVDDAPTQAERRMARWDLAGFAGDIATPLVLWSLAYWAVGLRAILLASAAFVVLVAVLLTKIGPVASGSADEPDREQIALWTALREAAANKGLLLWLLGSQLCSLLDEILAALSALSAQQRFASSTASAAMLVAFSAGGMLGALSTDRLLRTRDALSLLTAASALCAAALAGFLLVSSVPAAVAVSFVLGASVAPLYPIAKAQAYRALPGRPGTVNAASHLFSPLDFGTPVLLGLCADHFGPLTALALLSLQPLGLLVLARRARRGRRRWRQGRERRNEATSLHSAAPPTANRSPWSAQGTSSSCTR